ncbi:uncharacterized protein LOC111262313 isoform X2 [Varroa jacobsoni]|uniref:Chitin-binding type-2 domain-containing protein n=1 Tax=Varroa destructor TaxID=109461 RepID=A0A7M7JV59_VARDE|nr:uncharacterized protein LOC111248685 isoform X2 [Varroa destructor]XP_022692201.1 uncharacterized protein LOC111262313 isoform X2 [Varroa jacobsoni]
MRNSFSMIFFAVIGITGCIRAVAGASPSSTTSAIDDFKCPEQFGYYADTIDCSKYFVCVFGDPLHESCTGGLYFSVELQTCDWPRNVQCSTAGNNPLTTNNSNPESKKKEGSSIDKKAESAVLSLTSTHKKSSTRPIGSTTSAPSTTLRPSIIRDFQSLYEDIISGNSSSAKEVSPPLSNAYDPQQPEYDEAVPPVVDSEGGIHISDAGKAFGSSSLASRTTSSSKLTSPRWSKVSSARLRSLDVEKDQRIDIDKRFGSATYLGRPDKIISPPIVTGPGRSGRARNLNHQEDVSVFVRPLQYEKKISNDGGPPIYYADKAENPSKEIVLVSYPRDGRYRELAVYEPPQTSQRQIYTYTNRNQRYYAPQPKTPSYNFPNDLLRAPPRLSEPPKVVTSSPVSRVQDTRYFNFNTFTPAPPPPPRYVPPALPEVVTAPAVRAVAVTSPSNQPVQSLGGLHSSQVSHSSPTSHHTSHEEDVDQEDYDDYGSYEDYQSNNPPLTTHRPLPPPPTSTSTTTTPRPATRRTTRPYRPPVQTSTSAPSRQSSSGRTGVRRPVTRPPGPPTTSRPAFRPQNVYPTPVPYETAAKCSRDTCRLPDCNCAGSEIPGGLLPKEVPQVVLLTFDDAVNDLNKDHYRDIFDSGRKNPNGCPIRGTFYVSHEWTDYGQVQNLYSKGHEMASHTVTHSFGEKFSEQQWFKEVAGQREILHLYGGVKLEDVRGMRAPFLQIGGNKQFKMLHEYNFTYDSSMPVFENNPPYWPYTLDYAMSHECMITPCPSKSFPGVWEVGMVMWVDLRGGRCSMGDACSNPPDDDGVHKVLMKNFNRHYKGNRAPFNLFYHSAWFNTEHHKKGFLRFLDEILSKGDVWLITNTQLIDWIRHPTSNSHINSFTPWQCNYSDRPGLCHHPTTCSLLYKGGVRYMKTCQPCPDVYPWVGNTGYGGKGAK